VTISARYGTNVATTIEVGTTATHNVGRPLIRLGFEAASAPGLYLDENHAAALVLALQAAIAEVQARAVSL
jgi:hypothetical protein